ncbi:Mu transposase C-terminal domain-containing protein [Vibrio rumoiensis]|uniref:Mu transposase C-terminal domain-containing protein n=1 Tax=Vibrio rumoiensis TaxID=76258 RepID=UPI000B5C6B54|nr:Mu transposase C-terminal domain-containing protein [Vibrio rumoiensis]
MFQINEVLQFEDKKYRILSQLGDSYVWISIDDKSDFPSIIDLHSLKLAIQDEILNRVDDPYSYLVMLAPEEGSVAQIKRDTNYELIRPIIELDEFYKPEVRGEAIRLVLSSHRTTKQTLYRLIRQYWQRGQSANALLPDYKNSGAKGKKRIPGDKKLGRPRKYMPGVGVNVDEFIEKLFRIAIQKYLLTDKGYSFPYAHRRFKDMYQNYFPGTPEEEIPSNWQMKHFYEREYTQVEKLKSRAKPNAFSNDISPLKSTANMHALGPGSRFEIDATIADIYVVSDLNRSWIVGRPVVYIVIDVFSRLVVGFYVGFENPSYVAAMLALQSAMTDKVELCREFNIEIDSEDCPAIGLPDAILADRGELLGHQIESLEKSFSVRIENTPPYRGAAKGIVENTFKWLQADFTPFAPGVVSGTTVKKRGGKDYRLDAKLSVSDFKEIILSSILYHNQYAVLEKYDRSPDMPVDLPLVPLELWNWGLQNRTGRLRTASKDDIRLGLLPRSKATTSRFGVCLFGVYYTSAEVLAEGWMHRNRHVSKPDEVMVAYDPNLADEIYLFPFSDSAEYWVCRLSDRSREFVGCSFWEVWQRQGQQKATTATSKVRSDTHKRAHERRVIEKIKQAEKSSPDVSTITKSDRISAIRPNKKDELEREREHRRTQVSDEERDSAEIIHLAEPDDSYHYPSYVDELFDEDDD